MKVKKKTSVLVVALIFCFVTIMTGCNIGGSSSSVTGIDSLSQINETSKKEPVVESSVHTSHIYDNGTITKQATCGEDGVKTYTCTECGETKTETIPKTGNHTFDEGKVTQVATCNEEGIITYTCTICGQTKTEPIAKTDDHQFDDGIVTKEATCGVDGERTFTCTVCGKTETESIPKTNEHTYDSGEITKEPTCAAEGEKTYTCTVCGETKTESVSKIDTHSYDGGTSDRKTGNVTYTCTECGASYIDTKKSDQALEVAQEIADYVKENAPDDAKDIDKVYVAAQIVAMFSSNATYTTDDPDYQSPYGVLVKGVYTCAGSTRALGLVLTCMGYTWEHVNEGEWSHQWCRLTMDGQVGYADGQVGLVGYGNHPAA